MITNKTVIISCAGMGKRLSLGIPKALVEVDNKPLIIRTLEQLNDVEDVRIVVGYQAEKVIDVVKKYRNDVTFVFNHNYMNTGTGASVSFAVDGAREYVLTIDGDLIVHPDDMKILLNLNYECICGTVIGTDDPVKVTVKDGNVVEFSRDHGDFEWTGVCHIKTEHITKGDKHVYHLLEPILPVKHLFIRTKEIDTINDFYRAEKWVKNNFNEDLTIGVLGGMGSFATLDFFRRYLEKFPANKEWERPRIVIDNNCKMPSRVRALLYGEKVEELNFQLNQSVSNLIKAGCTDVILACNTSHAFLDYIYSKNEYAKTIVHDIIQELYDEIKSKKICSPLYLLASEGTIDCGIYDKYFTDVTLKHSKEDYDFIRSMIEAVKTNNITEAVVNEFVDFVNGLPCENVILGCTELPILYNLCMKRISKNIYDPLETVLNNLYKKFK